MWSQLRRSRPSVSPPRLSIEDELRDELGGLVVERWRDVAVDAERDGDRRVTETLLDDTRMDTALERPPYSFVIHSAPVSEPADFYHWHIEILPKVTRFGAFEWATGFHRNPTLPETAAKVLREANGGT